MSGLAAEFPFNGSERAAHDGEWMRKERAREYRVAARREKRNRKADEKKQRKLNATILRRMTRNPEKYSRNAERNRERAIMLERRRIWQQAVLQAQNLAAEHDPSGSSFNVGPVVKLEDGRVITQEAIQRRQEKEAQKKALEVASQTDLEGVNPDLTSGGAPLNSKSTFDPVSSSIPTTSGRQISKKQQRRLALYEPRPPPPKPVIPEGISLPPGEEDWLSLWDLPDEQVERRIIREKKKKAAERKNLRVKQQSGKVERRAARDEKRLVYRDMKQEWKSIKEERDKIRGRLRAMELEEAKAIAVRINEHERAAALAICASLGYTVENTPGTADIKPKAQGMKGVDFDFSTIEKSDKYGDVQVKNPNPKPKSKRVDLSAAASDAQVEYVSAANARYRGAERGQGDEVIKLDIGQGDAQYEALNFNHKLRRKLRRAIDHAEIMQETLVRERAIAYFKEHDMKVPAMLNTAPKPVNVKGRRILENGSLETDKQERVRSRVELAEFNNYMKILRTQAKEAATYAGLKKYAEMTGQVPLQQLPSPEASDDGDQAKGRESGDEGASEDESETESEIDSDPTSASASESEVDSDSASAMSVDD